jgi:hypothetical protein
MSGRFAAESPSAMKIIFSSQARAIFLDEIIPLDYAGSSIFNKILGE